VRILQQCIYFPPEVGGLESHAFYLCRELVRQGHQVTMMTSRTRPDVPERETMDGIDVVRKWFPKKRNPVGWASHTLATVPHYMRLAERADILHAQTFASAVPAMRARRKYGLPMVLTLHTSHFLRLAERPAWKPVLRRIVRSADWLLAASAEIRDVALGLHPHPRAEALTNGVDTDMFVPRPRTPRERPRLIVPRRLFEKNGVEFFIRALPLVRQELEVDALLVGDGPERGRLEALAAELGVSGMVTFRGAVPNTEMPALVADADVAVFPSLMEATSVAALEAMSCAVPVLATRVGGLPEIVSDEVGGLCEPADPASLAGALVALLRRPDLAGLGETARQRVVDRWSVRRLADRHLEIYETLLREKRR
jgi:glycosyltransferase involved in cell wall biosynthesis